MGPFGRAFGLLSASLRLCPTRKGVSLDFTAMSVDISQNSSSFERLPNLCHCRYPSQGRTENADGSILAVMEPNLICITPRGMIDSQDASSREK